MRTSMNLPDALLAEAKAKAAAEGSTVTQLVVEGLRTRVAAPANAAPSTLSLPTHNLGRSVVNISDNVAVRDILDSDGDREHRDPR